MRGKGRGKKIGSEERREGGKKEGERSRGNCVQMLLQEFRSTLYLK